MKKVLCLLTALVMALGCFSISVSAADYGTVLNNNVAILVGSTSAVSGNALRTLPAAPAEINGVVMMPVSAVSVLFGGSASYDASTGFIDLSFGPDKVAVLKVGSANYTLNGFGRALSAAPAAQGGQAFIPMKDLIQDIIGQVYFYDASRKLVIASSRTVIRDAAAESAVLSTIVGAIQSGDLPEITVPTSYELDWSIPVEESIATATTGAVETGPIDSSMSNTAIGTKINLSASMLKFSSEPEENNPGINAVDGSPSSVWATQGLQEMNIDLGAPTPIACVGVQMKVYDDGRSINYAILVSSDGNVYRSVFDGGSAAGGGVAEYHTVGVTARYVRITTAGSTIGDWASVAEVEVYSGTLSSAAAQSSGTQTVSAKSTSPTGTKLNVTNATFTAEPESNNPGRNALDGNASTYWAVENANSMTIDLGSAQPISCVGVQMRDYSPDTRTVNYGVALSEDGSSYSEIYSGASPSGGAVYEYVDGGGKSARYVRINLNGSSANGWASLAEVSVYTGTGSAPASGGASGGATYPNLSTVTGEFIIADPATNNVLTVESDNTTLTVSANTKAGSQIWTLGSNSYGNTFRNNSSGVVMDVFEQSMNAGGQIGVWENNDGNNQAWTLELDGSGYYVRNVMSGLYLSNNGGSIVQLDRGNATKWVIANRDATVSAGASITGEFQLAVAGTRDVLTVEGDDTTLSVSSASSSSSQLWTLDGAGIKSSSCGYFIDVFEQSMNEGGQVGVWEGNGGTNQSWSLEKDGDSYYIKNAMSGLYLSNVNGAIQQLSKASATKWNVLGAEVEIAETPEPTTPTPITEPIGGQFRIALYGTNNAITISNDGTDIILARNRGLSTQKWTMEAADGGFIIKNAGTDEVLEVPGESVDPGRKLGLWEANGGAHQTWVLEKLGGFYYIKNVASELYISYDETGVRQRTFDAASKWSIR